MGHLSTGLKMRVVKGREGDDKRSKQQKGLTNAFLISAFGDKSTQQASTSVERLLIGEADQGEPSTGRSKQKGHSPLN